MAIIVLFNKDLRIADNPALYYAAEQGSIVPIYIQNNQDNTAANLWLDKALDSLNLDLDNNLNIYIGDIVEIISNLCSENISGIYMNKNYHAPHIEDAIRNIAIQKNIEFKIFNATLLWSPNLIKTNNQSYYKVYTHFKNACLAFDVPQLPLNKPNSIRYANPLFNGNYIFQNQKWHQKILNHWTISERGALNLLEQFVERGLKHYKENRNFPAYKNSTSRLSPYIQCGQISIKTIFHHIQKHKNQDNLADADHYISELLWREFAYYVYYHFPELPYKNFNPKFDKFSWKYDEDIFAKWKMGLTGCPIVDAGMRELWQTGYMHNRVRMIAASFLVKNLMIHWKYGAEWFMRCLVDADIANNSMGWQWVAGSGLDAAPYYRIFSPDIQTQKFDPKAIYIKSFVNELSAIETEDIFNIHSRYNDLRIAYPKIIINLHESRLNVLEEYKAIKI